MRLWAEIYNTSGVQVAWTEAIISANVSARLDEAGTFDLQCGLRQDVIDYLVRDNEIALFAQEDNEQPVEWLRGIIIKARVQETGDNLSISISGRDLMEELRRVVVGLGRSYTAQPLQVIMSSLASLVSGWTASVETAYASQLQTARFDGTKVLKAMLQSTKQTGLHIRYGSTRQVEIGVFGQAATTPSGEPIWAIKPPSSIGRELYSNDAVLLIDQISVTEDGDTLVNWAIPMGAGEGSAATTLKDTTYEIFNSDNTVYQAGNPSTYPIYRRVNSNSIVEYYIDATLGDDEHQDTLSFKEIGPIANSTLANQYASDALADACMASLARTRVPNTTYTLTVKKVRVDLQPGDKIHVAFKGIVPMVGDPTATRPTLTYIDVDEDLWVMEISRNFSDSGISTTLKVSTIDKHVQDDVDLLVEVLDRSDVRNLIPSLQPYNFDNTWQDSIKYGVAPYNKDATFPFTVNSFVTRLPVVIVRFKTLPLWLPATFYDLTPAEFNWDVRVSIEYPSDVQMFVNGVDVTSLYAPGGNPWNFGGVNAALDVTCDISNLINEAAGGLYQTHTIVFKCGSRFGEKAVYAPLRTGEVSQGIVELNIFAQGHSRAT